MIEIGKLKLVLVLNCEFLLLLRVRGWRLGLMGFIFKMEGLEIDAEHALREG